MNNEKTTTTEEVPTPVYRELTFAENAILTAKVLGGFGLLGAVLWGVSAWVNN